MLVYSLLEIFCGKCSFCINNELYSIQHCLCDFLTAAVVVTNPAAEKPSSNDTKSSSDTNNKSSSSIAEVKAKLKTANAEKPPEMVSLQQEESVSISGSNARLMVMQRLTRKKEVCTDVVSKS